MIDLFVKYWPRSVFSAENSRLTEMPECMITYPTQPQILVVNKKKSVFSILSMALMCVLSFIQQIMFTLLSYIFFLKKLTYLQLLTSCPTYWIQKNLCQM